MRAFLATSSVCNDFGEREREGEMRAIVLFLRDISQRPLDLFLMGLLIAGYLGASELV